LLNFYIGNICCNLLSIKTDLKSREDKHTYYEHYHSYPEFQYVIKGSYRFRCKNNTFEATEGDLLFIPPRTYHHITHTSDNALKLNLCIDLKKPKENSEESDTVFYNTFIKETNMIHIKTNTPLLKLSLSYLKDYAAYEKLSFLDKEKMNVMCHMFLLEVLEKIRGNKKIETDTKHITPRQQEEAIDTFFAYKFMSNSSKNTLAEELHISPRHLQRVIKKSYNMNYRQKLNEIRMEIATNMLLNTNKTVSQIADLLGYSCSANFSTFVKNYSGKTPSEIRKTRNNTDIV